MDILTKAVIANGPYGYAMNQLQLYYDGGTYGEHPAFRAELRLQFNNFAMPALIGYGFTAEDAISQLACNIIAYFNPPGKRLQYMPVLPKELQDLP